MRILVVTNLYPPHYLGGYELHCARVAEGLADRGHEVTVLTSDYGVQGEARTDVECRHGVPVHRRLRQYAYGPQPDARPWILHRVLSEIRDASTLQRLINEVKPDVLSWWNLNGSSKLLPSIAIAAGLPGAYSIEDRWLIHEYGPGGEAASQFWRRLRNGDWVPRPGRPIARLVGGLSLVPLRRMGVDPTRLEGVKGHAFFLSSYLQRLHREKGVVFDSWEVIRGGVRVEDFWAPVDPPRYATNELRILYVGQVTEDREVHTVIEALGGLDPETRRRVRLTVAGEGPSDYGAKVRAQGEAALGEDVSFLGKVPYESIPDVYRTHHLLVFSSRRPEGLGFTMIEAMLAGCAVATSGSGGAEEVATLANLPVFAPGNAEELRRIVHSLANDREKLRTLAARGQQVAMREFGLDVMLDRFTIGIERLRGGYET